MLFGLTNNPVTFQRLMKNCLGELQLNWCIFYLDDITIFATNPREDLIRLQAVFNKLQAAEVKLKPFKCKYFQLEVVFMGHVVSKQGIQVDSKMIDAVKHWPVPDTVTKARTFLGFANHYRHFMKGYAKISKSLYASISWGNANHKTTPYNELLNTNKLSMRSRYFAV